MAVHNKIEVTKVFAEELKVGMYISDLDRPWLGTPFLMQGFLIESEVEIQQLRDLCDFVYIDVLKSDCTPVAVSHAVPRHRRDKVTYEDTVTAEQEISAAFRDYWTTLRSVERMLKHIQQHQTLDSRPLKQHVKSCASSIIRNPAAMMWLSRIKHVDHYTAEHSLNVGVLAMSLGRHLGYDRQALEALGLCGLLHDVGKMLIDPEILNKPGKLTSEEFRQIQVHPSHSKNILLSDDSLSDLVLEAAYSHHERSDGMGYPNGVNAAHLNEFTRIVTIVDAFDAITSDRCYSTAKPVSEALNILYQNRNAQFDNELVIKFIECIGVYPPGTLVEMNSGEVGFVLNNTQHRVLPRVALLLDGDKKPILQHIVDLSAQRGSDTAPMQIHRVLSDGSHGLTLEQYTQDNIRLETE